MINTYQAGSYCFTDELTQSESFLKYTRKPTILHILHNITYLCNIIIYYIFQGNIPLTIKSKISTPLPQKAHLTLNTSFPFSYHYVNFLLYSFIHLFSSRSPHAIKCWTTPNLVNFVFQQPR